MKPDQQQQAQHLYFQTDLSKSEIASMVGISRRTLHYWVRDYNWDHIKKSAQHMPSQLAENCYFIMAKMQEDMLCEERREKVPTYKEVNALYKLTLTINKLKTRNTLNETLELGAHFMEYVNSKNPEDADFIKSYIDGYIVARAADQPKQITQIKTRKPATAFQTEQTDKEAKLDLEDMLYWAEHPDEAAAEENNQTHHHDTSPASPNQSIPLPKNEIPQPRPAPPARPHQSGSVNKLHTCAIFST